MSIIRIIDFTTNTDEGIEEEYFVGMWTRVLGTADRQWLEAPADTAECVGLSPILDIAPRNNLRGVFGYIAFGTWGRAGRDLFPDLPNSGDHFIAHSMEFINWKEQYFTAPKRCNAVRIWLREANRVFGHAKTAKVVNALQPGVIKGPDGTQLWPPP